MNRKNVHNENAKKPVMEAGKGTMNKNEEKRRQNRNL